MRARIALLGCLCGCTTAAASGEYRLGRIDGFLQVPRNGAPGTTSSQRPTLDELDIHVIELAVLAGRLGSDEGALFARGELLRLGSHTILQADLVSQAASFPAGSEVHTDIRLDRYGFGLERRLVPLEDVELDAGAGYAFFHLLDRIRGPTVSVDRGFSKGTLELALRATWRIAGPLALEASVVGTPPLPTLPFSFAAEARLRLACVFVGIAWERFDFADKQAPANHVRLTLGPLLVAGLEVGF